MNAADASLAAGPSIESSTARSARVALDRLFIFGLLLRLAVFFTASPFNSDRHLEVIDHIATHGSLPASNALQQSFHPPLYYLLMTPLRLAMAATWPVHLASCLTSCATLWLIRRLIDDPIVRSFGGGDAFRLVAFAFAATLGQFVMFGSFISNDPLAQLVGTLQFAAMLRYLRAPHRRAMLILAGLVAIGLLTKGTFLLTGIALTPLVLRVEWRRGPGRRELAAATIFCATWLVFGSYKYVENVVRIGRPIAHNLDRGLLAPYPQTIWRGPSTLYDVNVVELLRHPVIVPAAPGSYPLMLYATFWYAHLGDSSFKGNISGYESVGRMTYAVAVLPTVVFLLGVVVAIVATAHTLGSGERDEASRLRDLALAGSLALLAANVAVVVAAGVRYDRWECFQARLCFQCAMPIVVMFLAGASALSSSRWLRRVVLAACWATCALGVLYFLVEFALAAHLLAVDESILFEPVATP